MVIGKRVLHGSIAALTAVFAATLAAQSTASITGRVLDASGAVVAGATIEAVNDQTNFRREATSSATGSFVLELLPVGNYSISARAAGLKAFIQHGITLQVNQTATLDIRLEIGPVTERVTVEENVARVDTVTATLREVVDSQRIVELPLNGRNPLQLQALLPGVVQGEAAEHVGGLVGYAVNGGTSFSNNYFLDGGEFVDPFMNAPQFFPNPDALQEFTIQTNSSSAEYGRNRAGVIAAVTRSGTNSLHGGAFEFLRNTHLNARNFFAAQASPFHQNQFGAYLGGPIRRDKKFFFGSWESYRQSGAPGVSTITVLSERERRGDFSELPRALTDPSTGRPFPGNLIPASRLNPVTQQFLERFVPLPNGPNRTFSTALKPGRNRDQFLGKVDWQASERDRLTTRWIHTDEDSICAAVLTGWCRQGPYPRKSFVASHTRMVSPTKLNNFVFTWNRTNFDMQPKLRFYWKDLGANIQTTPTGYVHEVQIPGRFSAATAAGFIHDRDTFEISNTYSITAGNHVLRIGGQYLRQRTNQRITFLEGGWMRFNGQFTGDAAGDLILGRLNLYRQISPMRNALRQNGIALFVQDDWKVTSRLTLNLGLRWDPWPGFQDTENRMSSFRPGRQSQIFPTAPLGLVFPGDASIPSTITGNDWNNLAPRFGFAWTPTRSNRFAVRGGYGVFFDHIRSIAMNRLPNVQPFVLDVSVDDVDIRDPFRGQNPFPYTPPLTLEQRRTARFVTPASTASFNDDFVAPYTQQWNLNLQWEALSDYLFTAGYVGSKTSKTFHTFDINPALPRPDATVANIQARRAYQQYTAVEDHATIGYSQYHSLQLTLNKRFSGGFTLLASYTLGKNVGLTASPHEGRLGPRHPFNYGLDKGRMDFDVRHRFVNSFVWRLPGQARLAGSPLRHLLAGWETTGILLLQSGAPFTVRAGVETSLFGIGNDTADLIGNPRLDPGRPRKDLVARFFNTGAFARPERFSVGTSGINILDSPGVITFDLGVNKEFALTESHKLQFRSEFFNVLNRPNLGGPVGAQNSVNFGRILSAGDPRVIQFGLKYRF